MATDVTTQEVRATRAALDALQEERLLESIRYAVERSVLTSRIWNDANLEPSDISSVDEFVTSAPFLRPDVISSYRQESGDFFAGLLCVPIEDLDFVGTTSGTTGLSQALPQMGSDARPEIRRRTLEAARLRPAERLVLNGLVSRNPNEVDRVLELDLVPIVVDHIPADLGTLVQLLSEQEPAGLDLLTAPLIMSLADYERRNGTSLRSAFAPLRWIQFGGQSLTPHLRTQLESWNLDVLMQTSLGNIGIAVECEARDGCHAWEDLAFVECLQPGSRAAVHPGEVGELVVTSLTDRSAPLIRYRTGDMVRFATTACACGSVHRRFAPVGRLSDSVTIAGRVITAADVRTLVETQPACAEGVVQIVRPRAGEGTLTVCVGYRAELVDSLQVLASDLRTELFDRFGVGVDVRLEPAEDVFRRESSHKFRLVVDRPDHGGPR